MKPPSIEIPYNGQTFFMDVAEGNKVDLNKLHELSGSPQGKEPREWKKLLSTINLMKSINGGLTPISTKRGKGGGTWAHWQIALSYAQYLSPELHLVVNQIFKERLEEAVDPELGINRSQARAVKKWESEGRDEQWIAARIHHQYTRKIYVDTLINHDVEPSHGIGICTNRMYDGIFNKDKNEIEKDLRDNTPGLPKNINIRDHLKRSSIAAIGLAEAMAAEDIDDFDIRGVTKCAEVSYSKGLAVQGALSESRSKSPAKLAPKIITPEKAMTKLQILKEALKPK